jgi:hypothetical protein
MKRNKIFHMITQKSSKRTKSLLSCWFVAVVSVPVLAVSAGGAVLANPDFEAGDLSGWKSVAGPLTVGVDTNDTFNRNFSARIHGAYSSTNWITNSVYQAVDAVAGDNLRALGFVHWKTHRTSSASATGYVETTLSGPFPTASRIWSTTNSWCFFDLAGKIFGVADHGFESGSLDGWRIGCDNLSASVQGAVVDQGNYSMRMTGSFHGWSWNQTYQNIDLQVGDVIEASARINVAMFQSTGPWAVAGISLEESTTNVAKYKIESKIEANARNTGWVTLAFTSAPIPRATTYVYRAMICGYNVTNCDVYFDELKLWKQGQGSGVTSSVTLAVSYVGASGEAGSTSAVDVYVDSCVLEGSMANPEEPTNILSRLREESAAIGTNPAVGIPPIEYPGLYRFGYPGGLTNFPAYVEVGFPGWKFRNMRRDVTVTATNVIEVYSLDTNVADVGFAEFDQYAYVGKAPGKDRGEPLEIRTNSPYFTLGVRDNSSAEFGNGPFKAEHTYVVGTSLTNFPRRMSTDGIGWPKKLNIVFQENFSTNWFIYSRWRKHFIFATIATNGPACNVKAAKIGLFATQSGDSNELALLSQEIHMGWATEDECYGMVDYPNLTYQDHNEVALRAGWLHNLLDRSGWYVAQSPRGSSTIEPIDLYYQQAGNWTWRPYEEYLFTWPDAASGVRSLFDDDFMDRLPGQASYHVGFKIGHENGTNEFGEIQYPEALNIRGCGYYRMTDYDGVMAGSFRPMAADVFGLYTGIEDIPLIPKAYVRLVSRTTPTNEPDNSYTEAYQWIRSKTNGWYVGALRTQIHISPSEVASNGCYFDLEADTWAKKAVVVSNHGPLACFSQASMYWRGSANINDGTEGHDIDCVMLKKANGEWITHQALNPYTNTYQRTLSSLASNDVVYLMQQDRGKDSYGFATESPYRRASSFEITILDDGGLPLDLDIFENNTGAEITDNVNITCQVRKDLSEGERLHYKYRCRAVYAPGVYIITPNQSDGGENWSNNAYRIEFSATDGHDEDLVADIYYGNGLDGDWKLINTDGAINVSTNTHKVSYWWDVSTVPAGAYYLKATARRTMGGKTGFDVSNTRLQIGRTYGFPNNGLTNTLYWEGVSPVNVTNHNVLSFRIAGPSGVGNLRLWAKDDSNTTNTVPLADFIDQIVSLSRRIDIPWTNFPTIDRTRIKAIGLMSPASSNHAQASFMRSTWAPLLARSRIPSSPKVDVEGLPLFNPGETVTNLLTIENLSGSDVTGVNVQAVQEYAETLYWLDASPGVDPMWSAYTREGDRLCGTFEQMWSNRTVNAGASITLTNLYTLPYGRRVNHLRNIYEPHDWFFLRNYACRAQVDVSIRTANGDNVCQNQGAGNYAMDDDYDIDNDELPDSWELEYSGSYTGMNALADSDQDSFNNLKEYIAGTAPTNALSALAVNSLEYNAGGPVTIWFDTVTGRVYWVGWSANLINALWRPLNTNWVAGDGGMKSLIDSDSQYLTNRYYKIGVKFNDLAWPL